MEGKERERERERDDRDRQRCGEVVRMLEGYTAVHALTARIMIGGSCDIGYSASVNPPVWVDQLVFLKIFHIIHDANNE